MWFDILKAVHNSQTNGECWDGNLIYEYSQEYHRAPKRWAMLQNFPFRDGDSTYNVGDLQNRLVIR